MMTRFCVIRRHRRRPAPLADVSVYDHVAAGLRQRTPGVPPIVLVLDEVVALHEAARDLAVTESLIAALLAEGYKR